jgi:membrane-bound lytic murein transglycosylase A
VIRHLALLAALALIGGCRLVPAGEGPRPGTPVTPPVGEVSSAAFAGVAAGPALASLGLGTTDAGGALAAFVDSCTWLTTKTDASGLTSPADWQPACTAARTWPAARAGEFFAQYFETARVGTGEAFATGYFEPEIAGSRTRIPGFDVPVYKMPPDLVRGWPDDMPESERVGRPPLGRIDAQGRHVPYYERAEIERGALAGNGLEIAWAADPVEFFFLQIQGSGRLRAPDGSVMRIGYAGQNGREYVGIGSVMRERGLIGEGPGRYSGSMQGIMAYIRENPVEGAELMRLNKSWIFFQELTGPSAAIGPLGSIGVPVRGESTVAVDPRFVPYGAPVVLQLDRPEANGLWIAQDTGGAIKGANRFDTFWGAGERARTVAGGMSARGQALVLLPKGTVARLNQR